MKTKRLRKEDIDMVLSLLESGEVVAFPTDTVFGIGVVYDNEIAIEKMKEAKSRDEGKPFPMMVSSFMQMKEVAEGIEPYEKRLRRFMPGPLTIVVKKKECIGDYVTNGKDTIAIRMPDDPWVLSLLDKTGPLLVTSANLSGGANTTNEEEVLEQLDGRIAAVVEGKAEGGIPSTIIDLTGEEMIVLREGPISKEQLEEQE